MNIIPEDAKKVFWWVISDVYHYTRKDYDWVEKTFELVKWKTWTVVIATTIEDKIIVTLEKQPWLKPYYSLPWWRVSESESPLNNAKNELIEETWYSSSTFDLLWIHTWWWRIRYEEHVYIARWCSKVGGQDLDWGERIDILEFSYDDFLQICRNETFFPSIELKIMMYESLIDWKKYNNFKKLLFW